MPWDNTFFTISGEGQDGDCPYKAEAKKID